MSFPIHINNIYELLNEDGAPVPQVNVRTGVNDDKTAARPTQSRGTTQNTSARGGNSQGSAKPQGSRDGQRRTNENRPPRQENRPPRSIDRKANDAPVGGEFPEGAPVRRERSERTRDSTHRTNDRRVRNADQVGEIGGKRVFDRRSGTGRGREIKKSGAGRGNWGKEGEEQTENWDATPEEGKEVKEGEKTEEAPVEKDPRQEEEERLAREEQEKEDKLLTLDDYLKQKESTAAKIDLPKERKANEGVDQKELSKWGSYQMLSKKDEEDDETTGKKDTREKASKGSVPVDQVFNVREPPRPRADREDRGFRGRGNKGGRGGSRGGRGGKRGGESAPNFDLNSFPTLAPKA